MYKIGELSKLCHLPVKTLRYYDSEGLLVPDEIDRFTGYRYYSAARIADCNRIVALKELGFSLGEIRQHMQASAPEDILALIDSKCAELKDTLSRMESQLKQLECIKNSITEGGENMFDLVIRNSESIHVAYTRRIFQTKEEAYHAARAMASELPGNIIGQKIVIINYETEYCETGFDLAACVEITGTLPQSSAYCEKTISFSEETASLVCGNKELEAAYRFIVRRLEALSCQMVGAFYEIYYNDETVELKVPICRLSEAPAVAHTDPVPVLEDDAQAIGKWEFVDKVPSAEQFCPEKPKYSDKNNFWLKELYFLPGGQGYWIIDGWSKGYLSLCFGYPKRACRNAFSIHQRKGKTFLFLEMEDDAYSISRGGRPEIYVFEKVSDQSYTKEEIRTHDNTDMPFVLDEAVLGTWTGKDFISHPDCFLPKRQDFPKDALFFESVLFYNDGNASVQYKGRPIVDLEWTSGYLLDRRNEIAEAYVIREINGIEYLFMEWKSGDYTFGKRSPKWHVFTRKKETDSDGQERKGL